MGDSPKIELGELVCWWCGYGLDGVDLVRSDLRCPECGKENVPGNGPDAPLVRRPWPAWWVLAMQVCWPGALVGLGIGAQALRSRAEWVETMQAALAMMTFPAACFGVLWPLLAAEWIVDERVLGMFRRRWLAGVALGGIAVNGIVAAAVAIITSVLAGQ